MSDPKPQFATPEKEGNWFQQKTAAVKAWSKKASEEKLHLPLLLIIAALITGSQDSWFLGHVALASFIAVPTVKWFFGKHERSPKRWRRIALGVVTLTALIWGGIADGFENGVLYACLIFLITGFGWVKGEKMLASLIFICFVVFSEWGNAASFTAALLVTAAMMYMQGKIDAANRKNAFVEADLSPRPAEEPRPVRDWPTEVRRDYTGPAADQHVDPYGDRPAPVSYQDPSRVDETWHPGADYGLTDPRLRRPHGPVTGAYLVPPQDPGDDQTGIYTALGDQVHRPEESGPDRRRPVQPPVTRRRIEDPETGPQG